MADSPHTVSPDDIPPKDMLDLSDRVIIVTGSTGGIGSGISKRLRMAGAIVVTHRRKGPADSADLIVDLTSQEAPGQIVRHVLDTHGRIDGLVNNAGLQTLGHFRQLSDDEWREMIDVNLTASHRLTQAVARVMGEQDSGGSIVHIASIEGHQPTELHGHYSVSKAGLIAHSKAAALAYGPDGVRVNAISPGLINRPGLADDWPDGVERWTRSAPLGRMGEPSDIGDACLFLISDLSRWVTGIDLVIDGGVLTRPTW